ncbi:MAG: pyridoxamine 5'-phosphate oxidase family protein [Desulfobacterales bacterium]|nr:pyridoxamine 5'-phosphate oxidase family protein [Desulfobacterales bacterium]
MSLESYFKEKKGRGVLATSNKEGKVDVAVYSRPHVMPDGTLAFIMRDRLTHNYIQSNPHAAYMFFEDDAKLKGKRFFLTKIREERDSDLLFELRQRTYPETEPFKDDPMFLVFFSIDKELPLIGPGSY